MAETLDPSEDCYADAEAETASCRLTHVTLEDTKLSRLRYGEERRGGGLWYSSPEDTCHDCGVRLGGIHHPGCDVEECPRCRRQLISCGCRLSPPYSRELHESRGRVDSTGLAPVTDTLGAIIVAAGTSRRMGGVDKLFVDLAGKPLLAQAMLPFQEYEFVNRIVLVLSEANLGRGRDLVSRFGFTKVEAVIEGGGRRQDSVSAGLNAMGDCDYVAVHDGARPLVTWMLIDGLFNLARETGAAIPGVRIADTLKRTRRDGTVFRTLDRSRLWAVQTPQIFRRELLERAHREVTDEVTDDASMVEMSGISVHVFPGEPRNIKITLAEDLDMVRGLLEPAIPVDGGAS